MKYPAEWKIRGICVDAPRSEDVGLLIRLIRERFAADGINTMVLLLRYRFAFETHPECRGDDPLSKSDVSAIRAVCKENGIELIPKMNLFGHQSNQFKKSRDAFDGLLRGFPQFDETPELEDVGYCRSLCPSDPECRKTVLELAGEMADTFEAETFHIGCDEVFEIAKCPRCRTRAASDIFSEWITAIHDFLASKNIKTMMWGDRLLDGFATGYGRWEASQNGTEAAIRSLPKDILICDWHYGNRDEYPSVGVFADAGLDMLICPWRYKENSLKFIEYAKKHDKGNIRGILATTWCDSGDLARNLLNISGNSAGTDENCGFVSETYRTLFAD